MSKEVEKYFVFVKLTICEAAAFCYINSATICPSLKYIFVLYCADKKFGLDHFYLGWTMV